MSRIEDAIAADEADRAFECLRTFDVIVLAVSGGPDSLALLYLAAEWIKRLRLVEPRVSVATVDHGLRPEAREEAQTVARHAATLDLPHSILAWDGQKPATGIPNAARTARYALLDTHARGRADGKRVAVITAHHQDDQAETVFMRLARGGGVTALAAMPHSRALDVAADAPVQLVRPLLGFSKQRLIATLMARDVPWIEDPTNTNVALERTRVRETLAASGLTATALALTARRMRDAADGLAYAESALEKTLQLAVDRGLYARFDRRTFDSAPVILRQMFLSGMFARFGGMTERPEHSEIDALARRFPGGTQWSATLGGVVVSAGSRHVRLWREPGRISAAPVMLTPGEVLCWDGRFRVGFEGGADTAINVAPLGRAAYEAMAAELDRRQVLPAGVAYGLPAFYAGAKLLCVPLLGPVAGCAARKPDEFNALRFLCDPIHQYPSD